MALFTVAIYFANKLETIKGFLVLFFFVALAELLLVINGRSVFKVYIFTQLAIAVGTSAAVIYFRLPSS